MLDRTVPTDRGARPSPAQIKEWYRQVTILLNRLEGAGEEVDLIDDEQYGKRITGQTAQVYKTNRNVPGTWSWQ